ncbi:multidrug efflux SMR transporter [Ktedonosporobacter rubrisoli]|uniref:Multidrug efflux SMR transporter n=1 Tax=Ktedonosporobacter rubrisoli TaxID=2509675 RepID=A0A4V0YZ18_KTERU|nr:multidrug efflux SMR transporter [Ktedonosporobacter rubrisoli]QBD78171.1 multidrug efflux SMR transporter [Ktedonosporobacter rubrisoli]
MNSILYLILAILAEVCGTTSLKLSQGFTRLIPSILVAVFYLASFYLMSQVLKKLDVGMVYAIWSGMGTALIAIIGILFFKEPLTILKASSIILIILGVVGLNLGGAH